MTTTLSTPRPAAAKAKPAPAYQSVTALEHDEFLRAVTVALNFPVPPFGEIAES